MATQINTMNLSRRAALTGGVAALVPATAIAAALSSDVADTSDTETKRQAREEHARKLFVALGKADREGRLWLDDKSDGTKKTVFSIELEGDDWFTFVTAVLVGGVIGGYRTIEEVESKLMQGRGKAGGGNG